MRLDSPLGDALRFVGMSAREELGRLFEFDIEALSTRKDIQPAQLLGKPASVALNLREGVRHFHGVVCAMGMGGAAEQNLFRYSLVLRPWLWKATLRADTRIFQGKSVVDVLKAVFEPFGPVVEFQLRGSYPVYEYCVQYRETDFNFASRLMEQEGIYYYFRHTANAHTLVLVDSPGSHAACPGQAKFEYHDSADGLLELEPITDWQASHQLQPGKVVLTDYNFTTPATSLQVDAASPIGTSLPAYEVYDYPGEYPDAGQGRRYAGVRQQENDARVAEVEGGGAVRTLAVGHTFELTDHPQPTQLGKYLVVSTRINMSLAGYEAGVAAPEQHCQFTAMPASQAFRPERITPKPTVQGLHTAMVVGPAGEEIHTDKHGRVKVHFHWDRLGKKDENDSCWIRVATPWAGAMRGWVSVPRIGDEVVVDFIEGDPDRPLITGSVYNGANVPPWELPANKTQTGLLTRSTKGGSGHSNANVLRFEDKKGSEVVWLHAEKDQQIEVENDETHSVGHDRDKSVGHDETTDVGNNRTETVGKDESISIGNNRTEDVAKNETISIGDNRSESVGKNETIDIGKNRDETVGDNENVTIGKNRSHKIGKEEKLDVGENRSTQIGKDDKLQVGKKLVINAGDEISIVTGSASITMKKDGTIQIKGKDITVTGSGKIGIKASSDVVIKGSKIAEN